MQKRLRLPSFNSLMFEVFLMREIWKKFTYLEDLLEYTLNFEKKSSDDLNSYSMIAFTLNTTLARAKVF